MAQMATTTPPTKQLATLLLGVDVAFWVDARRRHAPKDQRPSYRTIANELRVATGGQVDVVDETIRLWHRDFLREHHGACPNCSIPTWHNNDPCPNEEAVAS